MNCMCSTQGMDIPDKVSDMVLAPFMVIFSIIIKFIFLLLLNLNICLLVEKFIEIKTPFMELFQKI